MPLHLALPASLEIRIIDHRSTPAPLAKRFKTGIDGRVYTNAELGCRLTAPAGGWSIEPKSQSGAVMLRFKVAGKDDVQVHFVAFALPASIEPKVLIGLRRKHYESKLKGLEILDDAACTVSGLAGHHLVFRHVPEKKKPRRAVEVVWRKAGSGYLLALDVEESDYDQIRPGFTALLESFEDNGTQVRAIPRAVGGGTGSRRAAPPRRRPPRRSRPAANDRRSSRDLPRTAPAGTRPGRSGRSPTGRDTSAPMASGRGASASFAGDLAQSIVTFWPLNGSGVSRNSSGDA